MALIAMAYHEMYQLPITKWPRQSGAPVGPSKPGQPIVIIILDHLLMMVMIAMPELWQDISVHVVNCFIGFDVPWQLIVVAPGVSLKTKIFCAGPMAVVLCHNMQFVPLTTTR